MTISTKFCFSRFMTGN
ncbi:peptide IlvX [Enterobacter hormaechei]|nr:peptide IlvX [Enterobacter cloacae]HCM9500171.1 hypothetical protein [Enterobacter asburiae]WNT38857.1 peptide IlvX [Enterobacter cloacae]HDR2754369.1 hypothetical protein [Enterobacter asburiae]HDR2788406.1 hypothetical protein [Enterobacter asburiae]HDR2795385.1 hypothetical protein [Enterobacter asburiae]